MKKLLLLILLLVPTFGHAATNVCDGNAIGAIEDYKETPLTVVVVKRGFCIDTVNFDSFVIADTKNWNVDVTDRDESGKALGYKITARVKGIRTTLTLTDQNGRHYILMLKS